MYIICETLAGNDPRYTSDLERIYSHWIYTAYYNPTPLDLELYDAIEVSESVARSMKFANVNKGKIGLRTGSLAHEEVFGNSTEADGVKTYYYIDESEEAETVELLRVEMLLHLRKHYRDILSEQKRNDLHPKKVAIEAEIAACDTLINTKILMHTKFGVDSLHGALTIYNLGPAAYDLSEPGLGNY
jgi:hypothetical protein